MKHTIIGLFVTLLSVTGFAKTHCSYELNNEDYWEDASGVLTVDGKSFNCKTAVLRDGDSLTLCKQQSSGSGSEVVDYIIRFDGAEAGFVVSTDLDGQNQVCSGTATVK